MLSETVGAGSVGGKDLFDSTPLELSGIRNDPAAAALLLFLQIAVNGSQIVVETGGIRIAYTPHFVNNRVRPRHGYTSIISSGGNQASNSPYHFKRSPGTLTDHTTRSTES